MLKINYQEWTTWTQIVGYDKEFKNNDNNCSIIEITSDDEVESINEQNNSLDTSEILLIDLEKKENEALYSATSSISNDILQIDVESFQQEFDQNSSYSSDNMDENDDIYDEIVQMYQEIYEEEVETQESLEKEPSLYDDYGSNSVLTTSSTILDQEVPNDFDESSIYSALETSEEEKMTSFNGSLNYEDIAQESSKEVIEWILQQQKLCENSRLGKVPRQIDVQPSVVVTEMFDTLTTVLLSMLIMWNISGRLGKRLNMEILYTRNLLGHNFNVVNFFLRINNKLLKQCYIYIEL